jgi:hypothetical protein
MSWPAVASSARATGSRLHWRTAGERSCHAGRTYELAGVTAVGGKEIATALAQALERPVRYEPDGWATREPNSLTAGLEPYQIGHTMSLLSNVNAGLLESDERAARAARTAPERSHRPDRGRGAGLGAVPRAEAPESPGRAMDFEPSPYLHSQGGNSAAERPEGEGP